MKASNTVRKVWDFAKNGSDRKQLLAIYICALAELVFLSFAFKPTSQPDTESYLQAGEKLFNGNLDVLRTPVYPVICHIVDMLTPSSFYVTITIIQAFVFFVSVFCFYRISTSLIGRRSVAFWCSFFYALWPGFNTWVFLAITESLSCSFVVIYFYYLVVGTKRPSFGNAFMQVVMLLLVLFIRPSFIYVVPITLLYWLYLFVRERNVKVAVNFLGVLLCLFAYLSYCYEFKKQFGVFATSSVSTVNVGMRLVGNTQLLERTAVKNVEMQKYISDIDTCQKAFQINHLSNHFIDRYGLDNYSKIISETVKKHKKEIARIYIEGLLPAIKSPVFTYEWLRPYDNTIKARLYRVTTTLILIPNITCGMLALLLVLCVLFLLKRMLCERRVFVLSLFTWAMAFGGVSVAIIGADADYGRLCLPAIPFATLLAFKMFDAFEFSSRPCQFD